MSEEKGKPTRKELRPRVQKQLEDASDPLFPIRAPGTHKTTELIDLPLFDRIVAARMKRMTAQDAAQTLPNATQGPVTLYGFERVLRTGWDESA
jgi:hypothetical protein